MSKNNDMMSLAELEAGKFTIDDIQIEFLKDFPDNKLRESLLDGIVKKILTESMTKHEHLNVLSLVQLFHGNDWLSDNHFSISTLKYMQTYIGNFCLRYEKEEIKTDDFLTNLYEEFLVKDMDNAKHIYDAWKKFPAVFEKLLKMTQDILEDHVIFVFDISECVYPKSLEIFKYMQYSEQAIQALLYSGLNTLYGAMISWKYSDPIVWIKDQKIDDITHAVYEIFKALKLLTDKSESAISIKENILKDFSCMLDKIGLNELVISEEDNKVYSLEIKLSMLAYAISDCFVGLDAKILHRQQIIKAISQTPDLHIDLIQDAYKLIGEKKLAEKYEKIIQLRQTLNGKFKYTFKT